MSPAPGQAARSRSPRPSESSSNTLRSSLHDIDGYTIERNASIGRGLPDGEAWSRSRPLTGVDDAGKAPQAQELERRKKRPRKTGGFLLDNAFGHIGHKTNGRSSVPNSPMKLKGKGKVSEDGSGKGTNGSLGGSPGNHLDVDSSRDHSPFHQQPVLPVSGSPRISDSLRRPDNLTAEMVPHTDMGNGALMYDDSEEWQHRNTSGSSVDPSQIVQMALSLSEGRRRHASGAYLTPPPSSAGVRRGASAGVNGGTPVLAGSHNAGGSLKKYLNEQRRMSRNISPSVDKASNAGRRASKAFGALGAYDVSGKQNRYMFSDATKVRADKARQHFETRMQFLRLLENLPPLRPEEASKSRQAGRPTGSSDVTNLALSRSSTKADTASELGRPFNPIQAIRNRKLRARLRAHCSPGSEAWEDPETVSDWVDSVELRAHEPNYRHGETVDLPHYGQDTEQENDGSPITHVVSRVDNAKTKRARIDWQISPEELLADAFWLEQGDNKRHIADRNDERLFPNMPATSSNAKISKEYNRFGEEIHRVASASSERLTDTLNSVENTDPSSPESHVNKQPESSIRITNPLKTGRLWHKRKQRFPSESDLDLSDGEQGLNVQRRRVRQRDEPEVENLEPLRHHIDDLIEKEKQDVRMHEPGAMDGARLETAQPLEPDVHKHQPGAGRLQLGTVPEGLSKRYESGDKAHTSPQQSRKDRQLLIDTSGRSRDSPDGSSATNSPRAAGRLAPPLFINGSPSRSRASSMSRLSYGSKAPFYDIGKRKDEREPEDHELDKDLSRRGDDFEVAAIETDNDTRPHHLQHPHIFKHKVTRSVGSSSDLKNVRDDREPPSAVTRFFRAGRIGGRFRGDQQSPLERSAGDDPITATTASSRSSSVSRTSRQSFEESMSAQRENSNYTGSLNRTSTTDSAPRFYGRKPRSKYHNNNLPAFKSSYSSQSIMTASDRSISRLNAIFPVRSDRSKLSRMTTGNTSIISEAGTDESDGRRRSSNGFDTIQEAPHFQRNAVKHLRDGLTAPGTIGSATLPIAGLGRPFGGSRSSSKSPAGRRPSLAISRAWSISDPNVARHRDDHTVRKQHQLASEQQRIKHSNNSHNDIHATHQHATHPDSLYVVSRLDIQRVRALLMCTGVKAETITRRAHEVRPSESASLALRRALAFTNRPHLPVPRREEHVLAGRMLAESYEGSVAELRKAAEVFTTETTAGLVERLEELKVRAGEDLMSTGLRLQDEAARVASEITTKGTREVQRVTEAVQALQRTRRRRLRWMRRLGWGVLEWALLAFMWWVWLVVVVVRSVLKTGHAVVVVLRWLFFL